MDIPSIATTQQAVPLENRDISQQTQQEQNNVAPTAVEAPQRAEEQSRPENQEAPPQQQIQDPQILAELNRTAEREKDERVTAEERSVSTEQIQLQTQLDNVSTPDREASFLIEA